MSNAPFGGSDIFEFTTAGAQVRQIEVQGDRGTRDLVVDANGDIQIYNGTFSPVLTTLDSETLAFSHAPPFPEWSTVNNLTYGGIAAYKNYVYATDMDTAGGEARGIVRFNVDDGTAVRFSDTGFKDVAVGLDGLVYGLHTGGAINANGLGIRVYDPESLEFIRSFTLNRGVGVRAIAVNSAGEVFTTGGVGNPTPFMHFDSNGDLIKELEHTSGGWADIDISLDGQTLLTASHGGNVGIIDAEFNTLNIFNTRTSNGYNFAAIVQPPVGFPIPPTATLSVSGSPLAEAGGVATVTATLSKLYGEDVTIDLEFSGTASHGSDYTRSGTQIEIPAGSTSGSITLTAVQDLLDEFDESIIVDIGSVTNGVEQGTQQVIADLTDDDDPPEVTLSLDGSPLAEGNGVATVTAHLSVLSGKGVTVDLGFSGTATIDSDYTRSGTQIVIPAGSSSGSITVMGKEDEFNEPNESIVVDIASVTNGTESGTQQVTATINNDEISPLVTLGIADSPLAESGGIATVTATLSLLTGKDVTVHLGFSGTATFQNDYVRSQTQIEIPSGNTTGSITMVGLHDLLDESNETIIVEITSVTNGTELVPQQVTAVINDDDPPPTVTLSLAGSPLDEAGGIATATVTLSALSGKDVTVNLGFSGTATNDSDYTRSGTQIEIPAGSASGIITLTGMQDLLDEFDETIIVDITSVINGTESGTQQVTVAITDDDPPPTVTLELSGGPLAETGGTATVTATLSEPSGKNVTVDLGFNGTATIDSDYTPSSTQILIPAGSTSGSITVEAAQDLLNETNETIIIDIASVTNGSESGTQQVTVSITDEDWGPGPNFDPGIFTPGNIIVSNAPFNETSAIFEFTTAGAQVRQIEVQGDRGTRDLVVDANGDIQIYNGTFSPRLTTLDSETQAFSDAPPFPEWSTVNNLTYGGIAAYKNYVYATDMETGGGEAQGIVRFNVDDGTAVRFADKEYKDVTVGLDGLVYGLFKGGATGGSALGIDVYDPESLQSIRSFGLNHGEGVRAIAVNSLGEVFTAGGAGHPAFFMHFDSSGDLIKELEHFSGGWADIDISLDGQTLLVASHGGEVGIIDADFSTINIFNTRTSNGYNFAAIVQPPVGFPIPPTATLSVSGAPLAEAGGTSTVSVTLSKPAEEDVTVNLEFSGTASHGSDYTRSGTQIEIPAGSTSGSITLTGLQDLLDETDETIIVDIGSVTNGVEQGTQQVIADLTDDDDPPEVTLSLDGSPLAEGNGVATVTATLSEVSGRDVTVDLEFSGTATIDSDYTLSGTQIVIPSGSASGSITVMGVQDLLGETDETIIVDIASVTNGTESGTQQVIAEIIDQEISPLVTLGISGSPLVEGGGVATVTATLSLLSGKNVTVDLGFSGTATIDSDYIPSDTQIQIPAGSTTGSITLNGVADALDEVVEAITVDITSVTNGTELETQQVTAVILDDDPLPTVTLSLAGSPLDEAGGVATVTAALSALSGKDVTVNLGFSGTATNDSDYTSSGTQIEIPAGSSSGNITLMGVQNPLDEFDRTIIVDIISVNHGIESGTQQVTAVIADDDPPASVTLELSGGPLAETGGTATVTATLSKLSGKDVTVDLVFSGTATNESDYTRSGTQIEIPAGSTSGSITITIVRDLLDEFNETIIVDIASVTNGTESGTQQVTTTITDEDWGPGPNFDPGIFTPGNIIVSNAPFGGSDLFEFTTAGVQVRQIEVQGDRETRDLVMDANGDIQIYNGTFSPVLTTLDSETLGFSDALPFPEWSTVNNLTYGGIAAYKNYVYATDMDTAGGEARGIVRFNVDDGTAVRFADKDFIDVSVGLDGLMYALYEGGAINANGLGVEVYDPVSLEFIRSFTLNHGEGVRTIAVNSAGEVFTAGGAGHPAFFMHFDSNGDLIKELEHFSGGWADIDISLDGQTLLVASHGGEVGIIDAGFSTINVFNTRTSNGLNFAAIVQPPVGFPLQPTATLSVSGSPLVEAGGVATVTATLSEPSGKDITIDLEFSGTASHGSDYTRSGTQIEIPAGSTFGSITLTATQDLLDETDETIIVDIGPVTNGVELGSQQVTAEIIDSDSVMMTLSLSDNGETSNSPANVDWLDEWDGFWAEIWVSTPDSDDVGITAASLDLIYNTQYFTAVELDFTDSAFPENQSGQIDDLSGKVTGISGTTTQNDIADTGFALLVRVRFESTGTDNVALDTDGQYIQPVIDSGFGIENQTASLVGLGSVHVQQAAMPATEFWPVTYDFNDDSKIDFADFAVHAGAFHSVVDANAPADVWASDFNFDGIIGFGDFSLFAANFRKTRGSGDSRVYQNDHPGPPDNLLLQTADTIPNEQEKPLSEEELAPIVNGAVRRLVQVHGSEVESRLQAVDVQITDLPGRLLGRAVSSTIFIDRNAAGFGWFVDSSPGEDSEFSRDDDDDSTTLVAISSSPALGRVDLLTVVMHELAHALGLGHEAETTSLMEESLPAGVRRLFDTAEVDVVFESLLESEELLGV